MPIVLPTEGLNFLLDFLTGRELVTDFVLELFLFTNDVQPTRDTKFVDLAEATFGGYARVTIDPTQWTLAVVVNDKVYTQWGASPTQWTVTSAPQTLYGYGIVEQADEKLLTVGRFASPRVLTVGATPEVLPQIEMRSEFPLSTS